MPLYSVYVTHSPSEHTLVVHIPLLHEVDVLALAPGFPLLVTLHVPSLHVVMVHTPSEQELDVLVEIALPKLFPNKRIAHVSVYKTCAFKLWLAILAPFYSDEPIGIAG